MANLKAIRLRIVSVKGTQQITKAMRMVAAAKMRRATEAIHNARPYADKLNEVIKNLSKQAQGSSAEVFLNPLFQKKEVNTVLILSVAADRGLCGGFNANINKNALSVAKSYTEQGINVKMICIGKKSFDFFKKYDYEKTKTFSDIFNHLKYETASEISKTATSLFLSGEVQKVVLIYNEFKSAIAQEQKVVDFLPVASEETNDSKPQNNSVDYIFEPSPNVILETLLPKHLTMQVWKALLDSNAAEQAARMAAMESATENAKELIKTLQLFYNRSRQAAITQEISEIVGGAEALS
ncbi:ATP synthase F1 subunit gamma [bacterium]|nr:ATP synthase F1 subunit gamma [bacterium]